MRPEDIREFNRQQPFEPYRIYLSDGKTYDIQHPDQALVLRSRLDIGVGGEDGIPDRVDRVSLIHIARVEGLPTGATPL